MLIASLRQYGWTPDKHDCWIDPVGDTWAFAPQANIKPFLHHLGQTVQVSLWQQAAKGWNGQGLQAGFVHDALTKKLKMMKQKGELQGMGLLKCVDAGGSWLRARRKSMGLIEDDACPLCNRDTHTDLHAIWACPATCRLDDPRIHSSMGMTQAALEGARALPCFWLRGLVLAPMMQAPAMPSLRSWTLGVVPDASAATTLYLDGSGGIYGAQACLRRCGWGYVQVLETSQGCLQYAYVKFGTLEGDQHEQTVPRAEMRAVIEAARDVVGPLHLHSDCLTFVRGHMQGPDRAHELANDDLWDEWWAILQGRTHPLTLTKVQAHATAMHIMKGTSTKTHMFGNALADLVAGLGAEQNQHSTSFVREARLLGSQADLVMDRIVAALSLHWSFQSKDKGLQGRGGRAQGCGARARGLQQCPPQLRAARVGHAIHRCSRGWRCTRCMEVTSKANIVAWLRQGACKGPPPQHCLAPAPKDVHVSHLLHHHRGIWWCKACGAFMISVARSLRVACRRVPTYSGQAALERLALGLTPIPRLEWPLP